MTSLGSQTSMIKMDAKYPTDFVKGMGIPSEIGIVSGALDDIEFSGSYKKKEKPDYNSMPGVKSIKAILGLKKTTKPTITFPIQAKNAGAQIHKAFKNLDTPGMSMDEQLGDSNFDIDGIEALSHGLKKSKGYKDLKKSAEAIVLGVDLAKEGSDSTSIINMDYSKLEEKAAKYLGDADMTAVFGKPVVFVDLVKQCGYKIAKSILLSKTAMTEKQFISSPEDFVACPECKSVGLKKILSVVSITKWLCPDCGHEMYSDGKGIPNSQYHDFMAQVSGEWEYFEVLGKQDIFLDHWDDWMINLDKLSKENYVDCPFCGEGGLTVLPEKLVCNNCKTYYFPVYTGTGIVEDVLALSDKVSKKVPEINTFYSAKLKKHFVGKKPPGSEKVCPKCSNALLYPCKALSGTTDAVVTGQHCHSCESTKWKGGDWVQFLEIGKEKDNGSGL